MGERRMKLYWSSRSPFVRKVMIAAHELGIADRVETVRTFVALSKPNLDLLPDNPLGRIPTLVLEDGSVLYDSLTICEYFDSLAGPRLVPGAGPLRWTVLTWHALGTGMLETLVLWRNERDKPQPQQTPEWLAGFALKTAGALDRLEALAPALDATPFGIGHIAIGCALSYLDFRFASLAWRTGRDQLAAWNQAFEARPSVLATQAVDA
jgi:glutathione S-transferase